MAVIENEIRMIQKIKAYKMQKSIEMKIKTHYPSSQRQLLLTFLKCVYVYLNKIGLIQNINVL